MIDTQHKPSLQGEYVLIHIIYSGRLSTMRAHILAQYTSYVSPLHLIEGKGTCTIVNQYQSTIVVQGRPTILGQVLH
jgi:hypothetical protein